VLDKCIPYKDFIKKILTQTKVKADHTTKAVVKKQSGKTKYLCHICGDPYHFEKYNLIYHYAVIHYRQKLEENFPQNANNECCFCLETFTTQSYLFNHYARDHEALKGIMPDISTLQSKIFQGLPPGVNFKHFT